LIRILPTDLQQWLDASATTPVDKTPNIASKPEGVIGKD
jgi:hypothetical protein